MATAPGALTVLDDERFRLVQSHLATLSRDLLDKTLLVFVVTTNPATDFQRPLRGFVPAQGVSAGLGLVRLNLHDAAIRQDVHATVLDRDPRHWSLDWLRLLERIADIEIGVLWLRAG